MKNTIGWWLVRMVLSWAILAVLYTPAFAANNAFLDSPLLPEQALPSSVRQGDVSVTVTWVYADATRITVEYVVTGVTAPSGYRWAGCAVRSATLTDGSSRQFGKNGVGMKCEQPANSEVRVTHSFYQDLSNSMLDGLPLQFTVYVGGVQVIPNLSEDAGDYTINAEFSPDAGAFTFDIETDLSKGLTLRPRLKEEGNGIAATLREVQMNPTFVASDICITLPTTADWHPEAALLTAQGRQQQSGWEVLNFKQSKAWANRQRCYRFTFPAALDVNTPQAFQIEIVRLTTSLPEAVTEEACVAAKEKRQVQQITVDFACYPLGSGFWFEVTHIPEGISEDEAQHQVVQLFVEEIKGPWTFEIETQANNR